MKKNKAMRLASLLLVVTLLSTCVVSGTFAKYTTQASTKDSARVAKFGIVVSATGDTCFATDYDGTVTSSGTDKLVAPGTANSDAASFSISGQAEVTVDVDFSLGTEKDVFLAAGTYLDYTTGDDDTDEFTLTKNYYPVVFTLVHTFGADCWPIVTAEEAAASGGKVVVEAKNDAGNFTKKTVTPAAGYANGGKCTITGTLDEIDAYLTAASDKMQNLAPNYKFDDSFALSWKWVFDGNDKADTALGNIEAEVYTGVDTSKYCLDQSFDFKITVTQVD